MKIHLNEELVLIAKRVLLKKDLEVISGIHETAVSTIAEVVAGRRKTTCEIADSIQKMCAMRLSQNQEELEKQRELIRERCSQKTKK